MEFLRRREKQLKPSRPICPHNFRPPVGVTFGKTIVCVVCVCDKIEETLQQNSENENVTGNEIPSWTFNLSASTYSEIIHNIRIINTSLDNLIGDSYTHHQYQSQNMNSQMIADGALFPPTTIKPVIDTFTGLLQLPNDEIGLTIAHGVQKICPKITLELKEYLMEKVASQMQKAQNLTIGLLECLRFVLLMSPDILVTFLQQFGRKIMPKLLQTMRSSTNNITTNRSSKQKIFSSTAVLQDCSNTQFYSQSQNEASQTQASQQQQYNFSQSQSQNWFEINSSGLTVPKPPLIPNIAITINKVDGIRINMSIFSILNLILESLKTYAKRLDSVDLLLQDSKLTSDIIAIVVSNLKDFLPNVMLYLKDNQPEDVIIKILEFLNKLLIFENVLSTILETGNYGHILFTALKRMLLISSINVPKETVNVLRTILVTYLSAVDKPMEERSFIKNASELPRMINHVDLIHAISQIMATSDPEFFGSILNLLSALNIIPELKGKLTSVLESGLRVASILISTDYSAIGNARNFFLSTLRDMKNIPISVQQQLISVYGKLPDDLEAIDCLEWTKLLLHCINSCFLPQIVDFLQTALNDLGRNLNNVVYLKRFLLVAQVVVDCCKTDSGQLGSSDSGIQLNHGLIIGPLLGIRCVPAVMVLVQCAQAHESVYVKTLLHLLNHYPMNKLIPSNQKITSQAIVISVLNNEQSSSLDVIKTQDVCLSVEELYTGPEAGSTWNSGVLFRILIWIRSNMELLKDKELFDRWNNVVANLIRQKYIQYLPSLAALWTPLVGENNISFLSQIYENMELDMDKWKELNNTSNIQVEGVLIFYYFYSLFNRSDPESVFCDTFTRNLHNVLQKILTHVHQQNPSEITQSQWELLSVYFKIGLLIISCQVQQDAYDFIRIYEELACLCVTSTNSIIEFDYIVTFCGEVFSNLISWNLLPVVEMVELLENWYKQDSKEFKTFFLDHDNVDSEFQIQIIDIAAQGSESTSKFMVELVHKKQIRFQGDNERRYLFMSIIRVKLDSIEATTKISNYFNLLGLALADPSVLHSDIVDSVPAELYGNVIKIFASNHRKMKKEFGLRSLKFLYQCFRNLRSKSVLNIILDSGNFCRLLTQIISTGLIALKTQTAFELRCVAYQIIGLMVSIFESCWDDIGCQMGPEIKIKLQLSALVSNMNYTVLNDSSLGLLTELLRVKLKSRLVKIYEEDPEDIFDLLTTFWFSAQSIISTAFIEETKTIVWKFLYQLLRFSNQEAGMTIFIRPLAYDPWIRLIIAVQVIAKAQLSPYRLSVPCLKFVRQWSKSVGRLQKELRELPTRYEPFNLGSLINELYTRMSITSTSENQISTEVPNTLTAAVIPTREKFALIQSIADLCSKLRDPSIDWPNNAEEDDSSEDEINTKRKGPLQPQRETVQQEENEPDSDRTCSISELIVID